MDAAYNNFKKLALLFATALLIAAPSFAYDAVQLTANPTSVALFNQSVNVTVTSSAAVSPSSFTVTPNGDTSFFAISGQTSTTTSVSFTVSLTYNSCGTPFAPCNSGNITVTSGGGGTVDIPVKYSSSGGGGGGTGGSTTGSLSIGTTAVTLSNGIAQSFTVNRVSGSATSYYALATVSNGTSNWLLVNAANSTSGQVGSNLGLTISANTSNLFPGTYTGQIALSDLLNANDVTNIAVTLQVTTAGSGGGQVAPTALNFAYPVGGSSPQPQSITVSGTGTYTISTTGTVNGSGFISANGSGTAPGSVLVTVNEGLPAGTYSGSVVITNSLGPQSVAVNLVVSSGVVLTANPASFNVFWAPGSGTTVSNLSINSSDSSPIPITVVPSASWVRLAGLTGNATNAAVQVTIDPSGLPNGLNTASITVTGTGAANSPLTIPVIALVSGSSGTGSGSLSLSPSSFTFSGIVNGAQPPTQTLTVGPSGTNYSATVTGTSCGWLSLSSSGSLNTSTTPTITVSANQAGLTANTYSCNISLTSAGGTQTVGVKFVVSTSGTGGGSGNVTANPTSLTFSYTQGGTLPDLQGVVVSSTSGSASVGITTSVTSGSNWLSVTPSSASTQVTLSVTVNPGSLAGGTYNGNIRITPNGGTVVNIPVTLTVQSLTVSASPTTLTFNYRAGDPAPTAQTLSVSGGTGLTFSATAASTGNWLQVTPATGTAPATLNVTIDPTTLTSTGAQTGTITVAGTGSTTGSTTVNVTINVTAPLPTIAGVTNGASFAAASTISAGEVISLFGTNIGPSTPVGLTSSVLDPNGNVPKTLGGVQVLVGGYPAAMIYASGTQVSAVVPYEIASPVFRVSPNVQVKYLGQTSNGVPVTQVTSAPGLFTANSSGAGPGAILNQNSTLNAPANPANKGDTVVIYMTGEGQTNPQGVTGKVTTVNPAGNPLTPQPLLPVAVLIDGQPAKVAFYGEAPGIVSGVMQVNVQIPANARSGDLPITVQVGSNISQTGVTVSVK
jgi:uncharacterized protein (TIGR03437 family)